MFNNSSNLYGSEWLALVFSNRNKSYGAYELRSQSATILTKSLFIAGSVFIALFIIPMVYAHFKPAEVTAVPVTITTTLPPPVIHEMKKVEPKKAEPVKVEPVLEKVKTVNMSSNIKVVQEPIAEPPTTAQINDAVIASITQDGVADKGNILPITPTTGTGGGGGTAAEGVVDNSIHNVNGIDVYPEFPGGMAAWAKFIQRTLRYPYMAQESGVQGKVYLSFVIEKDGAITDVNVTRGIGAGCDEEAVRVLKKSPKWKAGLQNNQAVRVRYNMPINYTIAP